MKYIVAYNNENMNYGEIDVKVMSDYQVVKFVRRFLFDFPEDITTVAELSDYYYNDGYFDEINGSSMLNISTMEGLLIIKL